MNINLTMFAQAISFAILIWFTIKFVWPPLLSAIETRQKEIADGLAAGERGRNELDLAAKRASQELHAARENVSAIIAQAEKRASEIVEEAKASAKQEGDRILVGARAEIDQEVNRAKELLRQQVVDLAIAGAEKILRKEIDAETHSAMLSEIAKEL